MTIPGKTRHDQNRQRQGRPVKTNLAECCYGYEGKPLKGWALAWHRYSAHGGPFPRRSQRERQANKDAKA